MGDDLTTETEVYQCPYCGHEHYFLYASSPETDEVQCSSCNKKFIHIKSAWKTITVPARKCPNCKEIVAITPPNMRMDGAGYLCPGCKHMWYTKRAVEGTELLIMSSEQKSRAGQLDGFALLEAKNERDLEPVIVLGVMAKEEECSFRVMTPTKVNRERFKVFLVANEKEFVGYVLWNVFSGKPCVRQIYVRPEFRKKGIASAVFKKFVDAHGHVYVESPNAASLRILEKLGYVEKTGEVYRGIKVSFAPSF